MSVDITMHYCRSVRFAYHHPDNSNCITLRIEGEKENAEITLFDLPIEVTDRIRAAFGNPRVLRQEEGTAQQTNCGGAL